MEFDATVDWFYGEQAHGGVGQPDADLRALAEAGARQLDDQLGAAAGMHDAAGWLVETATGPLGLELQQEMVAAIIAADHYDAKVACPQRLIGRMRRDPWRQYVAARSAKARSRFSDAMVLWSVMERIPVDWMVPEKVFAQMQVGLAEQGYADVRLEGRLLCPFPGGAEWVRTECSHEIAALQTKGVGGVRAAVLYWPGCATAAVLEDCVGGFKAHTHRLPGAQVKVQWNGPNVPDGLLLLDLPQPPPVGWFVTICGRLHLGKLAWKCSRRWRLWRRKR